MKTKLTLSVDSYLVSKAKNYVMEQGISLSKAVEDFFKTLSIKKNKTEDIELTPKVKSLMGSFKLPENFDYKKELEKALIEKYLI